MNRNFAAAIGGLVATFPMTAVMSFGFKHLPRGDQYPLPPREITDELARRSGQRSRLSERRLEQGSLIAHFAYGGLTGAMYPIVAPGSADGAFMGDRPGYHLLFGAGYGIAIWAGSYMGWLPALHILGPNSAQPAKRRRLMLTAHLIWGACTVLIGESLSRRQQ